MRFAPFLASVLLLSACGRKDAVSQPVRIVALLPDPRGAADEHGEWVTLRNGGGRDADLAGWRLDSGGDAGFTLPRGTVLRPGESLTLARALDRRRNGGVAARVRLRGITLGNRADWLALRDASGRTVDSVAWLDAARGVEIPGRDRSPRQTARTSSAPPTPAALEIRVLNVGQGDAILIRSGSSLALIDGGPDPALLGRRLDALGIGRDTTIDVVVLTHAHADHYQGLRELFRGARRLRVRWFVENGDPSPQAALRRLRDSVGARVRRGALTMRDADDPCGDGRPTCTFTLRGGATLHVLRPLPRAESPNDRSVVVKLVSQGGAFAMLLLGDAQQAGLRWLERSYARAPGLDVDVLKASHHGSCDGVTPGLLRLTSPTLAIASLAGRNDYGHVHARTKAIFAAADAALYRTDRNGDVVIRVPGDGGAPFSVRPERAGANLSGLSDRGARCD